MSRFNFIFLTIWLISCSYTMFAQTNDAQIWTEVKIDHKLNRKFTSYLDAGLRFSENITETGLAYSEIGLDYKINKSWELSGGYRYASKRKNEDYYSVRHRFNLDLTLKKSYYLFNFQLRTRAEMQYKDVFTSVNGSIPDYQWRNKLQLKYNFTKKFKPFIYLESYTSFSASTYTQYLDITKMKYCLGTEYKINKRNSIECYYLIQQEYHQKNPYNYFVYGITYNYSF
ncbi:MAG: DUF2490 domain-containing protein [Bacteroidales bacterium]